MFAWSLYSALLKKKEFNLSPISLLQVVITFGVIFLIPMYFIDYSLGSVIKLQSSFYLVLFYVVFFPGLISFLFWIKGVKLIGANRSGVFLHLMIIFNEKILFYHFLGAIFIIAGITISNKKTQNA
jgi:drug/metabolite transporter (DMT)-like permease